MAKKLRFKKAFNSFRKDQVASLPDDLARQYVESGVAESFSEENVNQANIEFTGRTANVNKGKSK